MPATDKACVTGSGCNLRGEQHPFFQMSRDMRIRSCMRIVRHHDDRLVKVLIQPLQDFQDFGCGVTVEIARLARRLVTASDR